MEHRIIKAVQSKNCPVNAQEPSLQLAIADAIALEVERLGPPQPNVFIPIEIRKRKTDQELLIGVLCKPRTYKEKTETSGSVIGWAIAFFSPIEYNLLRSQSYPEVDALFVKILDLSEEDALFWTKKY